jgi:hypothetical protein
MQSRGRHNLGERHAFSAMAAVSGDAQEQPILTQKSTSPERRGDRWSGRCYAPCTCWRMKCNSEHSILADHAAADAVNRIDYDFDGIKSTLTLGQPVHRGRWRETV